MCGIHFQAWMDPSCTYCQTIFSNLTIPSSSSSSSSSAHHNDNPNDDGNENNVINVIVDDVDNDEDDENIDKERTNLRRRGPDAYGVVNTVTHPNYHRLCLSASVLRMRHDLVPQPVPIHFSSSPGRRQRPGDSYDIDGDGCGDGNNNNVADTTDVGEDDGSHNAYLCWNGEVYQQKRSTPRSSSSTSSTSSNDNYDKEGEDVWRYETSDTMLVANLLQQNQASSQSPILIDDNGDEDEDDDDHHTTVHHHPLSQHIASVMSRLYNAEYAFFLLTSTGVHYGRDVWGRRSLLQWMCPNNCGSFQIVSVVEESVIPAAAVTVLPNPQVWTEIVPGQVHTIYFSNTAASDTSSERKPIISSLTYPKLSPERWTNENILRREEAQSQRSLQQSQHQQSQLHQEGGRMTSTTRDWDSTTTNISPSPPVPPPQNVSDRQWRASIELEFHLRRSVEMRLDNNSDDHCQSTGILFSGGIDSVILAALAADLLSKSSSLSALSSQSLSALSSSSSPAQQEQQQQQHQLHLYNVSFGPHPELSADRKAAWISYKRFQERYGDHVHIIFHDIVVNWDDMCHYESHIRTLLLPKSTVMDVNIATALWFAAKGSCGGDGGLSNPDGDSKMDLQTTTTKEKALPDEVPPRVLLVGMGADEQLGGYGRHRKAYERGGWDSLRTELAMDQHRLWERNLGRDDRLCSDHGKEVRFPFLDAHVVHFLTNVVPLEDICDFTLPPGQGDKQILRLIGQRLGFDHASGLVKRAIQFGSRIAHLSDTKRFGSRRKAKGEASI